MNCDLTPEESAILDMLRSSGSKAIKSLAALDPVSSDRILAKFREETLLYDQDLDSQIDPPEESMSLDDAVATSVAPDFSRLKEWLSTTSVKVAMGMLVLIITIATCGSGVTKSNCHAKIQALIEEREEVRIEISEIVDEVPRYERNFWPAFDDLDRITEELIVMAITLREQQSYERSVEEYQDELEDYKEAVTELDREDDPPLDGILEYSSIAIHMAIDVCDDVQS